MSQAARRSKAGGKRRRSQQKNKVKWLYATLPAIALLVGLAGCTTFGRPSEARVELAPVSQLSQKVRTAPAVVQEAYRFAIANPDILEQIPCYCGCGAMGHQSDLDCFVESFNPDGSVVFGYHAFT